MANPDSFAYTWPVWWICRRTWHVVRSTDLRFLEVYGLGRTPDHRYQALCGQSGEFNLDHCRYESVEQMRAARKRLCVACEALLARYLAGPVLATR